MDNRLICVGQHRLGEMCLQLCDHGMFPCGFDHTYIITSVDKNCIQRLFDEFDIDQSDITVIHDADITSRYPVLDSLHWWLRQQLIKLCALDQLDYDTMTIHDPDALWIQPFDQQKIMFYWDYVEPNEYYRSAEAISGIPRQTPYSLVTDFMIVEKNDWHDLKILIERRSNKHWLESIIQNFLPDQNGYIWFSEYELLGNWIIYRRNPILQLQRRLEITSIEDIRSPNLYDVIINKDRKLFRLSDDGQRYSIYQLDLWIKHFPQYACSSEDQSTTLRT